MLSCRSNSNLSLARLVLSATVFGLAVGCSEPKFSLPTSPTESDSTSTTTTTSVTATDPQTFTGTLIVRGQRFYSFTVPSTRTVRVTLEQLHNEAGTASAATLVLGIGVPSGTGCAMLREVAAGDSDAPHLDESLTAGVYCTQLTDRGTFDRGRRFLGPDRVPVSQIGARNACPAPRAVTISDPCGAKLAPQIADVYVESAILWMQRANTSEVRRSRVTIVPADWTRRAIISYWIAVRSEICLLRTPAGWMAQK